MAAFTTERPDQTFTNAFAGRLYAWMAESSFAVVR